MEAITKTPGFQHVSEDILKLLDKKSLMDCRMVNSSWKAILDQSTFWLKKMIMSYVPKDAQKSWKMLAQKLDDVDDNIYLTNKFVLVLIKICQGKRMYPLEIVVDLHRAEKYPELVKFILEHENTNVKYNGDYGCLTLFFDVTSIFLASYFGYSDVIKKILMKYDLNKWIGLFKIGSPIHLAAFKGQLDVVKILTAYHKDVITPSTSTTELVNMVDKSGGTPMHWAAYSGHLEIVEYLVDVADTSLIRNIEGHTPIDIARKHGRSEVENFLLAIELPKCNTMPNINFK